MNTSKVRIAAVKHLRRFHSYMPFMPSSFRLAALALAAAATSAQAAELGDANVRSYIGQPLSAEIELTDLTPQDLAGLQVRLASPDVFQGANVTLNPALAGMNIAVVPRDQRRVLRISTSAPLQGEVVHLYFALTAGGKERVRGISLWLTPDPNPPVRAAVPPPVVEAAPVVKPVPRATVSQLVARAAPGKEATPGERDLLNAMERAFAGKAPKEAPAVPLAKPRAAPVVARVDELKKVEAAKKAEAPKKAEAAPVEKPGHDKPVHDKPGHENSAPEVAKPAPVRKSVFGLPDKAALAAEAAEQRAALKMEKPAAAPVSAPAAKPAAVAPAKAAQPAPAQDAAMMNKLAELEKKLKSLQTQLASDEAKTAAAYPAASSAAAAMPKPAPVAGTGKYAAPVPTNTAQPAAAPVEAVATAAPVVAAPEKTASHAPEKTVAPAPHEARAAEPSNKEAESPKQEAEPPKKEAAPPKKEAEPPKPPEVKKEIKISRPKMLTMLFAASLVLLVIFGIIVHFIRRAKMRKSTVVRQSWRRDSVDDDEVRTEPTAAEAPPEEKAA